MKYTKPLLKATEFTWLLRTLTNTNTVMQCINANRFVVNILNNQKKANPLQLTILKYNMIYCYKNLI